MYPSPADPVGNIVEAMTNKRSVPLVKKKLLEMGLVSDLKELRKKRASKSGGKKSKGGDIWGGREEVDDSKLDRR